MHPLTHLISSYKFIIFFLFFQPAHFFGLHVYSDRVHTSGHLEHSVVIWPPQFTPLSNNSIQSKATKMHNAIKILAKTSLIFFILPLDLTWQKVFYDKIWKFIFECKIYIVKDFIFEIYAYQFFSMRLEAELITSKNDFNYIVLILTKTLNIRCQ